MEGLACLMLARRTRGVIVDLLSVWLVDTGATEEWPSHRTAVWVVELEGWRMMLGEARAIASAFWLS